MLPEESDVIALPFSFVVPPIKVDAKRGSMINV